MPNYKRELICQSVLFSQTHGVKPKNESHQCAMIRWSCLKVGVPVQSSKTPMEPSDIPCILVKPMQSSACQRHISATLASIIHWTSGRAAFTRVTPGLCMRSVGLGLLNTWYVCLPLFAPILVPQTCLPFLKVPQSAPWLQLWLPLRHIRRVQRSAVSKCWIHGLFCVSTILHEHKYFLIYIYI